MTEKQIIEMVKQIGWNEIGADLWGATHDGAMSTYALQRFAQLVRNAALEEVAVKCENEFSSVVRSFGRVTCGDASEISDDIAKEIRSLKS